jgi:hypothetical protein
LRQVRRIFVYGSGYSTILDKSLSEVAFPIHELNELYAVVDDLRTVENRGGQMHLL